MTIPNVGLNSTFDFQRQVINQIGLNLTEVEGQYGQLSSQLNELAAANLNFGLDGLYTEFNVGIGTSTIPSKLTVQGDTLISGVTTSVGGFSSEESSSPVKITVSGSNLIFEVVGVGSATLPLV